MDRIRRAGPGDASRVAEILIFTKRANYRRIFHNDYVSFGEMQVYPLAQSYLDSPQRLSRIWVYDDGIVKGMVHIEGQEVRELYVDPFFQNQGIGGRLMAFAVERCAAQSLFVLEENTAAIRFYRRCGFRLTDQRQLEPGTEAYVVKMERLADGS